MCAIDVTADAVTDCATDKNVREKMVAACVARDADRAGNSVSANLDQAMIVVFVCDHRGQ